MAGAVERNKRYNLTCKMCNEDFIAKHPRKKFCGEKFIFGSCAYKQDKIEAKERYARKKADK